MTLYDRAVLDSDYSYVNCQLIIDTVPGMNNKNILMPKISLSTVYTDSFCSVGQQESGCTVL